MTPPAAPRGGDVEELDEREQLVLSDLINRVLDKGVVISANVLISIADIDLIHLDLRLFLTSVATQDQRADVPVRSPVGS
jgi:hypothetical protein